MVPTLDEKIIMGDGPLPDIEIDAKDPSRAALNTTAARVVLIPQPSDDPEDPLVRFPIA
jgi:hypothetical protein